MKKALPRVAVLVDTSSSWGCDVIDGIANYVRATRAWHIYLRPLSFRQQPFLPEGWRGDGVIARVNSHVIGRAVDALGCPVVNVSGTRIKNVDFPRVAVDEDACADMAVNHLRSLGLSHFALFIDDGQSAARRRRRLCAEAFMRACLPCAIYRRSPAVRAGASWEDLRKDVRTWLRQLPKPVGMVSWGLFHARLLSELCMELDIMMPEEVAILSIGSEHLMSTVVSPTISEVNLPSKRQGFLAAEMLDRLMQGKRLRQQEIRLAPQGILAHESTDLRAIADPCLRKAINFIQTHVDRPLTVGDILKEVPLSRRGLERRFMSLLHRSPAAEIRRVRLDRTCRLLAETSLPMPEVASAAGWTYAEYMIPAFKKTFHLTPLQYRKQVQARA